MLALNSPVGTLISMGCMIHFVSLPPSPPHRQYHAPLALGSLDQIARSRDSQAAEHATTTCIGVYTHTECTHPGSDTTCPLPTDVCHYTACVPHSVHGKVIRGAVWFAVLHTVYCVPVCAWCYALSCRARLGSGKVIVAVGVKCNSVSF